MISIKTSEENEIFQAIESWIDALAEKRYSDAFEMVYVPNGTHWSKELLKSVVENYGSAEKRPDGKISSVTSTKTAQVDDLEPRWEIDWYEEEREGEIAEVIVDLPVNGVWADLTAVFGLRKMAEDLTLELVRIDVL